MRETPSAPPGFGQLLLAADATETGRAMRQAIVIEKNRVKVSPRRAEILRSGSLLRARLQTEPTNYQTKSTMNYWLVWLDFFLSLRLDAVSFPTEELLVCRRYLRRP